MFKTIKRIHNHIFYVQNAIKQFTNELDRRALLHDESKFREDELKGYLRFEDMPEGLEYGSTKYKAAMSKIMENNDCFDLHSKRNSHHPEFHNKPADMTLLDIIEMVCDWRGAHIAYGNKGDWMSSTKHNISRYEFTDAQKWAINQVAKLLDKKDNIDTAEENK